ncbi:hypothetical protein ILUMI_21432 [Ignelater luminosus]|uniref:Uncharacterized protein n=1 Tax=Ignelater luminosus TaxID=2038154 RepID=A0A8K0CFJ9_IGNLU|nr:hypothetical protein ILUMI_21432 [Ignelater luminosus]
MAWFMVSKQAQATLRHYYQYVLNMVISPQASSDQTPSLEGPSDIQTLSEKTLLEKKTPCTTKGLLQDTSRLPKTASTGKARATRKVAGLQVLTGSRFMKDVKAKQTRRAIFDDDEFEDPYTQNDDDETDPACITAMNCLVTLAQNRLG